MSKLMSQHKRCRSLPLKGLANEGIAFLAQMAGKVVLGHTSEDFPHIIKKLGALRLQALFNDQGHRQTSDRRPARAAGISNTIVCELAKLRDLYGHYLVQME